MKKKKKRNWRNPRTSVSLIVFINFLSASNLLSRHPRLGGGTNMESTELNKKTTVKVRTCCFFWKQGTYNTVDFSCFLLFSYFLSLYFFFLIFYFLIYTGCFKKKVAPCYFRSQKSSQINLNIFFFIIVNWNSFPTFRYLVHE